MPTVRPRILMQNPYQSSRPSIADDGEIGGWRTPICVATGVAIVVVANYGTSTSVPSFGPQAYTHVIFLLFPFTAWLVTAILTSPRTSQARTCRLIATFLTSLVIGAFLLAILPYFTRRDSLGFTASNYFFGPYGYLPWMWCFLCAFFPLTILTRYTDNLIWVRISASVATLLAHSSNAWVVWVMSHTKT